MAGTSLPQGFKLRPVTPDDHAHNLRVLLALLARLLPHGALQLPSMSTAERDAIAAPTDGMAIYNTTTGQVQAREGGAWVDL